MSKNNGNNLFDDKELRLIKGSLEDSLDRLLLILCSEGSEMLERERQGVLDYANRYREMLLKLQSFLKKD